MCTLPFTQEGRSKSEYAWQKKQELEQFCGILLFDQDANALPDEKEGIAKSFEHADDTIYRFLKSAMQIQ